MERIITVKGRIGRYDVPSFVYTDNEPLTLRFNLPNYAVGKYIAVISCGEQKKKVYLKEGATVDIPPEFIQKGGYSTLYVLLELRNNIGDTVIISNDSTTGGFFIEPLNIEQVNDTVTAQAWMSKIEEELSALLRRCILLEDKLATFEDEGVPLLAEELTENE